MKFNFLGPSNPLLPVNVDVERTVNFYIENTGPGTPKASPTLLYTPGRHYAGSVTGEAVRTLMACGVTSTGGRVFGLSTNTFFEITPGAPDMITVTEWGTVAENTAAGQQSTLCTNGFAGDQVFIVSGGQGYIFTLSTNTFAVIGDTDFPIGNAGCGVFLDGYFIVLNLDNSSFQLSALEDGTTWDPLDVAQRSDTPDSIVTMVVFRNELWLMGHLATEVWYDSGFALFPFQPVQGALIQIGVTYPRTVCVLDNALWFTGIERSQGSLRVWRAVNYTPVEVSTQAVTNAIGATDFNVDQLRAWTYAEGMHSFYGLRLPTNASWFYDQATGLWHERGVYNADTDDFDPDYVECHVQTSGLNLCGDSTHGVIWNQSLRFLDDECLV